VPISDALYDLSIKEMFGSSLPSVVCRRAHALSMLFVFVWYMMVNYYKLDIFRRECRGIEIEPDIVSDSTHHFFRNACTKSGSLRFSQFSGAFPPEYIEFMVVNHHIPRYTSLS
jgi:hypothetical protein